MYKNLKNFKEPLVLTLITLGLILLIEKQSVTQTIDLFIDNFQVLFFILAGIGGILGAISFGIPYVISSKIKPTKIFAEALIFTRDDCLGGHVYPHIENETKIKIEKSRYSSELLFLVIAAVSFLFFMDKRPEWYVFAGSIITFTPYLLWKLNINELSIKMIFAASLRYIFEFPRTYFGIATAGILLPVSETILFLVSTSMLYSVDRLKGAGGLLEIFCSLYFYALGYSLLYGFLVAMIFRFSGIIFFIFPMIFYNVKKEKSKKNTEK